MKGLRTGIIVLALLVVGAAVGFAQTTASHDVIFDVSGFYVIALDDGSDVTLAVTPAAPGADITGDTDATQYLQYTVLTAAASPISINVTAVDNLVNGIPNGTSLTVAASGMTGNEGSVAAGSPVTITNGMVAADIIDSITSVATGTGVGDGALLTYTFAIVTPSSVTTADDGGSVTVTYTITN